MSESRDGNETAGRWMMPAEWERHEATWIGWPHDIDWPGKFDPIPWVFGEIARKIAPHEQVRLIADSETDASAAREVLTRLGVERARVEVFQIPTDRCWARDAGPIFVRRESGPAPDLAIVHFCFNGWAKYHDHAKDALVSKEVASALGCRGFPAEVGRRPFVLEGGSIDVNGAGAVLTTEECLLDRDTQPRNPHLSQREIEQALCRFLGVRQVLWLGRGIAGDDTHGHVDDVCRFVSRRVVVLAVENHAQDENYAALQENYERLQGMRLDDDSKLEVIKLPMPAPLFCDGRRLPASYANFYVCNSVVLAPTFNDPMDRVALGMLGELFPDREVVGIHAVDLVFGGGAIHCVTQQQPAALAAASPSSANTSG